VLENRVLRRIFEAKRDEVMGGWRKLHDLPPSPSIIRVMKSMRLAGHVAQSEYRLLVGKRSLGRPRHRWVDNIKIDPVEIGLSELNWIGLAQNRYRWRALVNLVMSFRVP
jgi:hypothetical protein